MSSSPPTSPPPPPSPPEEQSSSSSSSTSTSSSFLPWGDVNVVMVTDVHSWVAGHPRHAEKYDADYGHVLSFYQRLQEQLKENEHDNNNNNGRDLFFVMNGDFCDGTGLSTIPPSYLTPILQHMPWDAVNMGNHELYHNETVQFLLDKNGFIDFWQGNYLTSNVLLRETQQPIGHKYTLLKGKHSTLLTFGFLFNFEHACEMTQVQRVQDAVKQDWFREALLHETYHAILVMAHMDCISPLVQVILKAIRSHVGPNMPVQFITGHTHRRCFELLEDHDGASSSIEAGRYLDTVGFVSFSKQKKQPLQTSGNNANDSVPLSYSFRHAFIDGSIEGLRQALDWKKEDNVPEDFLTPDGQELSVLIQEMQQRLELETVLGCSPADFALSVGYHEFYNHHHGNIKAKEQNNVDLAHSLWGLYLNHVVPTQLFFNNNKKTKKNKLNNNRVFVQQTGAFRYSLFSGAVTLDDVIEVCPFNDTVFQVYVSNATHTLAPGGGGGGGMDAHGNPSYSSSSPARRGAIRGKILMAILNDLQLTTPASDNNVPPNVAINPEDDLKALPAWGVAISTSSSSSFQKEKTKKKSYHLDPNRYYQLFVPEYNYPDIAKRVSEATGQSCVPIPATTTVSTNKKTTSTQKTTTKTTTTTTTTMVTTTNMWRDFVVQYWPSCDEAAAYYSHFIIHNSSSLSSSLTSSLTDSAPAGTITTITATPSSTLSSSYSSLSWLLLHSSEQSHPQQQHLIGSLSHYYSNSIIAEKRLFRCSLSFSGALVLLIILVMGVYNGVVVRLQRERPQQRQQLHEDDDDDNNNNVRTHGQQQQQQQPQKRQQNNKRRQRCIGRSGNDETEPLLLSSYSLYSKWSTTATTST